MYVLRDYQDVAVTKGVEFFNSVSRVKPMLVLPTGSGKSIIIAYTVKALEGNVLILQPSKELLEQNYLKYDAVIQDNDELEPASVYSASVGIKEKGRVTFATIGSVYKKPELFSDIDFVIVDECHKVPPKLDSMYVKFFSEIQVQVAGLTATPYRLKSYTDRFTGKKYSQINLLNRERPLFFNKFLHITQTSELYEKGYLCPVKYIEMNWDGSFLKFNTTGAEYSEKSTKEAMERNNIIGKIPNILKQAYEKGRKSCLVFVRSVDEARDLAKITPFSNYIHALTPKKERAEIIKSFKNGSIKTMFNVAVLTTGFDYPALDTIIIARPTMSLSLFVQMVGRGMRIDDKKENLVLLDMCGNLKRFGKLEELEVVEDGKNGWVLRNSRCILSGRRLDELV